MKFISTPLRDATIIEPKVFGDSRGFFMETYNARDYAPLMGDTVFVQDNHSRSSRHVLRGLHYQIQQPQAKLVRVTRGAVLDVIVDCRRSSPTFGQTLCVELSEENQRQLYIPQGFAHGFHVLSDVADFQYKASDYYAPAHERCILWNDPDLAIDWRLQNAASGSGPLLSDKDKNGVRFKDADLFD